MTTAVAVVWDNGSKRYYPFDLNTYSFGSAYGSASLSDINASPTPTPDGKAFIALDDNHVVLISTTGAWPDAYVTQPDQRAVAVSPDGSTVWVTDYSAGTAHPYAIDTTAGTITAGTPLPVGPQAYGLAITPDGGTLIVGFYNSSGNISFYDIATRTLIRTVASGTIYTYGMVVSPDSSTVYVNGYTADTIVPIDISTGVVGSFTAPTELQEINQMVIDSGGQWFATASLHTGGGAMITAQSLPGAGLLLFEELDLNPNTNSVSFAPDREHVLFAVEDGPLCTYETATWNLVNSDDTRSDPNATFLPDQAPTASFTSIIAGLSVAFTDTSTSPAGTIAAWAWEFGDSNTSTAQNPTHVYAAGGTYTVTLTVTNSAGTSTTQTFTGQTVSNNGGPSAMASQPVTVSDLGSWSTASQSNWSGQGPVV